MMTLTLLVDGDTAPALNSSLKVEDILVLHLEKGKDFFISIAGNYLPSCFGSCLETLVHLHTYIREIPVAQLLEIDMVWYPSLLPRPRCFSLNVTKLEKAWVLWLAICFKV